MSAGRPLTVLIVDDEEHDLEILSHAFGTAVNGAIRAERSATAALELLRSFESIDDVLVITDLNMPSRDGCDLIAEVRRTYGAAPIVLVLSTSDRRLDIDRAYAVGANGYHTKPMGFHDTAKMCAGIVDYWSNLAQLPGIGSPASN